MQQAAVVILNYNGAHFLRKFLPGVIQYSKDHEIIVADNGSTDDSAAVVKEFFPAVRYLQFDKNYGFCGGYNKALARINAEFYILLNSDVEVTENWIEPVLALFHHYPDVAAVQPKMLTYDDRSRFEYAGAAGGWIDAFGYPFCRGRIFNKMELDTGQYDDTSEIFWASGACLFVRAELFHRFGGLDEDFFAHMEEIDLCWRMKHAGYRILFTDRSVIYHVGGGTLNKLNPQKTYLNFRNGMILLIKNLPAGSWWKIPLRAGLDWIAALKFMMTGEFANGWMVLKAHVQILANFRKHFRKRKDIYVTTKVSGGKYPSLLLYDYHVKRKTKFSELNINVSRVDSPPVRKTDVN